MQISAHFTLAEIQRASTAGLNSADIAKATELIETVIEPARAALGWPIKISSFKRLGDKGAHGSADAIDFHPCCDDPSLIPGRMLELFNWIRIHRRTFFGELGFERTHLHMTRRGYNNEIGEVWTEPREGTFVIQQPSLTERVVKGGGSVAIVLLLAFAAYKLAGG